MHRALFNLYVPVLPETNNPNNNKTREMPETRESTPKTQLGSRTRYPAKPQQRKEETGSILKWERLGIRRPYRNREILK